MNNNQNQIEQYFTHKKILFLYPHFDDESYSSISLMNRIGNRKNINLVYLSNGVPRKSEFIPPLSDIYVYDDYMKVRREEWLCVMKILNLERGQFSCLRYRSRSLYEKIPKLIKKLNEIISKRAIDIVFAPPYEGAHPDHDVCSFAAKELHLLFKNISILEYTGYHLKNGKFECGVFADDHPELFCFKLSPKEKQLKKRALDTYISQKEILGKFKIGYERIRLQPEYNYKRPPQKQVYYETWQQKYTAKETSKHFTKIKSL